MINNRRIQANPPETQHFPGTDTNNMLQFRNDSGFLCNKSGQVGGLYVIHGPTGTKKPACLSKDY
jgi:hypothetical protein